MSSAVMKVLARGSRSQCSSSCCRSRSGGYNRRCSQSWAVYLTSTGSLYIRGRSIARSQGRSFALPLGRTVEISRTRSGISVLHFSKSLGRRVQAGSRAGSGADLI